MEKITFELEAVTPMFIHGANQNDLPEFRPPSIKGLLRFWYRAIYPNSDLKKLKAEEDRLFGSTEGRSLFKLRGRGKENEVFIGPKNDTSLSTLAYMGYGPINREGGKIVTTRQYFKIGSKFEIDFFFGKLSEQEKTQILRSFWALSMFGGIGSRSRRGLGSFRVTKIEPNAELLIKIPKFIYKDVKEYTTAITDFIKEINGKKNLPEYTSFGNATKTILFKEFNGNNAGIKILEDLGKFFYEFRSYKKDKTYPGDHDLMLGFLNGTIPPKESPSRAAFGLPHNYFFFNSYVMCQITDRTLDELKKIKISQEIFKALESIKDKPIKTARNMYIKELGEKINQNLEPLGEIISRYSRIVGIKGNVDYYDKETDTTLRRASPLFIHIQGFKDNGYKKACGLISFFPAIFLPDGSEVRLSGDRKIKYVNPPDSDYKSIEMFLTYLTKFKGGTEIL